MLLFKSTIEEHRKVHMSTNAKRFTFKCIIHVWPANRFVKKGKYIFNILSNKKLQIYTISRTKKRKIDIGSKRFSSLIPGYIRNIISGLKRSEVLY